MDKKKSSKSIKTERFTVKDFAFLGIFVLLYLVYIKTKDEIINYPTWLNLLTFFIIILIVVLFHLSRLKNEFKIQNWFDLGASIALLLAKIIIISLFLTGIFLVPFNYINIYSTTKNKSEIYKCEITGVSTFSQNRKIFFVLNGRTNVLYGFKPIMEDIKDNEKFKEYYFAAEVRKGLLNSYILEGWSIEKK